MKKQHATKCEKGFFDLGLSVAILALSGIFAYAVTPDYDARAAAQETQIEVVADLNTANGNNAPY